MNVVHRLSLSTKVLVKCSQRNECFFFSICSPTASTNGAPGIVGVAGGLVAPEEAVLSNVLEQDEELDTENVSEMLVHFAPEVHPKPKQLGADQPRDVGEGANGEFALGLGGGGDVGGEHSHVSKDKTVTQECQ